MRDRLHELLSYHSLNDNVIIFMSEWKWSPYYWYDFYNNILTESAFVCMEKMLALNVILMPCMILENPL